MADRSWRAVSRRVRDVADVVLHPRRTAAELARLRREADRWSSGWPPGHFYSPVPSLEEVRAREASIFAAPRELPGVELNEDGQLALLDELARYYGEQPFAAAPAAGRRFHFGNDSFSYGEATVLYAIMRHRRPCRIVEIGSGYSSAAVLDVNDLFFGGSIACTFIEPDPTVLRRLLRPDDERRVEIIARRLQEVDDAPFAALGAGDILLVDSTHVAKVDSDVNHIFARVLPALAPGVLVHFHDIFHAFEYPAAWIYAGRAWNEAYMLRAFLQYNRAFRIILFNSFLHRVHGQRLAATLPVCAEHPGSSIWLERVAPAS